MQPSISTISFSRLDPYLLNSLYVGDESPSHLVPLICILPLLCEDNVNEGHGLICGSISVVKSSTSEDSSHYMTYLLEML